MPTCEEVLRVQSVWHKSAKQGCYYAVFMSRNPEQYDWKRICIKGIVSEELLNKINSEIVASMKDNNIQALSIILPDVLSNKDLTKFVEIAKKVTKWKILSKKIAHTNFTLIKINVNIGETTEIGTEVGAWILGFGKFDFFAKTRQSPYTEIAMTVKSKQYFKSKYNKHSVYQYTPKSQHRDKKMKSAHDAHLADIHLSGRTDDVKKDKKLWEGTQKHKRIILNLPLDIDAEDKSDDPRSKAKVAFVIKDYEE